MEKQLMELINDPEQFAEQSTVALQLLQKLCQQKAKTEFSYNGNTYCVICNQWIKNKSYKQLPCSHNAHIECFTNAMLKQSEYLILNELKYCCSLNAECASKVITQELLCQFFGRNKVSELQDIPNQLLIQELQQYEKIAQQERENQVAFDCQICYDNLKVNEDAITLDCEHRFCRGCITSSIQEHVNKGEYRDDQIVCPNCQASINNCIIKEWCPEEYKKIDDLRIKNFGTGQNNQNAQEKLINCPKPGCPEKFFVPHNIPFPQCPTCKNTICANGCDQGHVGKSCEEYKKKVKAVQAQGLVECPKCRVQIFKDGGCNHITCTCKHEFCYVCGKNYKPKKLCSCPQNATFERGFNKIKSFFGFI